MQVFGDTTPYHDKQPLHGFVRVYVADHLLASKVGKETTRSPEYIQSFEFNKLETSGTYTLVLFDKNWSELEETFNAGALHIKLQYGYVTGKQSPLYEGIASDYTVRYTQSGVILGINGIISNAVANNDLMTFSTGTKNPTEAVKSICSRMGYQIGHMDETMDVSLPNSSYFNLLKDHPVSYINLYIAPYARRKADGMSGFRFVVDYTTSPATAHFLPLCSQEAVDRTFICEKGINSSVISFEVQATGVFGGAGMAATATRVEVETIDPVTGEVTSSTSSVSDQVITTGEYSLTADDRTEVATSEGQSADMAISAAEFSTSLKNSIPYEGTLTILGDPSINIGDTIRILVPTTRGDLHLSSGLYFVKNVLESVSNGKYITALGVVRNGTEDGIQILNYKRLVK